MLPNLKKVLACAVVFCLLTTPLTTLALDPGNPGCDPLDPACPIDGGLSLLIAAGVAVGARKAYQSRKEKNAE